MHQEMLIILIALALFGVIHSLMAALRFKAWARSMLGDRAYLGLYRLLYNIFSGIAFLPILALLVLNPGPAIWAADGAVRGLLFGGQVVGIVGLVIATAQIDGWRFVGLRQALAYLNGDPLPLPPEPLITHGTYGLVRHPLYLFIILFLWASPAMNAASLGFAIGATLYFVIGAWLEECRMVQEIGAEYIDYQRLVPWMIPFIHTPIPRCSPPEAAPEN